MTAMPATSRTLPQARPAVREPGGAGAAAGTSAAWTTASSDATTPDPRIARGVEDVDEQGDRDVDEGERQGGQDRVVQIGDPPFLAGPGPLARREDLPIHGEHRDEQQPGEKARDGDPPERAGRHDPVEPPAGPVRRPHRRRYGDEKR